MNVIIIIIDFHTINIFIEHKNNYGGGERC